MVVFLNFYRSNFNGNQNKKFKKNTKWPLKKTEFFNSANSQYFFQKYYGLVLGLVGLIDAKALMWLNLYGAQPVRSKL